MCHISEEGITNLAKWAALEKRAAPLLDRLKKIQEEQKLLEDQVKAELASYESGAVETADVTVTFATRKGAVDWKALSKDLGISQETMDKHRKDAVKAFSFKGGRKAAVPIPHIQKSTSPKRGRKYRPWSGAR